MMLNGSSLSYLIIITINIIIVIIAGALKITMAFTLQLESGVWTKHIGVNEEEEEEDKGRVEEEKDELAVW